MLNAVFGGCLRVLKGVLSTIRNNHSINQSSVN